MGRDHLGQLDIKLILKKEGVRMWSESVQGPGLVADFGRR
jgi:hypothetical protein